jgi:hypothetical protein
LVGSNVTNAILWTAGGSNHKSIDEFALYKVMKVAINGADWASTNNVLEQLIKVINHNFDFCKKISVNMELMSPNVAWMAMYGIGIGIPQLALTLLANIKTATKSNYGREFCLAMHTMRKKYTYNHGAGGRWRHAGTQGHISTGCRNHAFGCQIGILPPSDDGRRHQLWVHQIGVQPEF